MSTHYRDSSLYGTHGTLTAMDASTDWVRDSTLGRWKTEYVYASSQYVNLASPVAFADGLPWAVSIWTIPNSAETILSFLGDTYAVGRRSYVRWYDSGAFRLYNTAVTYATVLGCTRTNGAAIHLVLNYDGSNVSLYRNAVLINSAAIAGNYSWSRIGANGTTYFWEGGLTDPLIYNRVLSLPEIQQLADPSNVMLSGLILPPKRKLWPVVSATPAAGNRRRRFLIAGVSR